MKIKVKLTHNKEVKIIEIPNDTTIANLLTLRRIKKETVIVALNGEITPESKKIKEGDEVEIIPVKQGG